MNKKRTDFTCLTPAHFFNKRLEIVATMLKFHAVFSFEIFLRFVFFFQTTQWILVQFYGKKEYLFSKKEGIQ